MERGRGEGLEGERQERMNGVREGGRERRWREGGGDGGREGGMEESLGAPARRMSGFEVDCCLCSQPIFKLKRLTTKEHVFSLSLLLPFFPPKSPPSPL